MALDDRHPYDQGMWWTKDHTEKPLREQLIEARDTLRRQIEILNPANSYANNYAAWSDQAVYDKGRADALRQTLAEIEEQLGEIGS